MKNLTISPNKYSANVKLNIETSASVSSYITKLNIYLDGRKHQTVTRHSHYNFEITGLKPYTNYAVGIETVDGASQNSSLVYRKITTKKGGT